MSTERILPNLSETGNSTFSVLVNGSEVSQTYEFLSIVTHKELNRIPSARLVLKDGDAAKEDFEISNEDQFVPGKEIEITAGYDGNNKTIFKGIIIKHGIKFKENSSSILQLECRDKSVKMSVGRKNKCFTDMSDSEVMEKLIQSYGLKPDVEATSLNHKELVQYYCSDWDFLINRAEINGKLVMANDGEVSIKEPNLDGNNSFNLIYGDSLYEFEAEMDARHQYKAVKCSSWNHTNQEVSEEEGKTPGKNGLGNFTEVDLANVIGLNSLDYKHGGTLVNGELKNWGNAQFLKSHLAKVVGRAKFRGVPELKPREFIGFEGVGERFKGKAYITAVRQSLVEGEFYTDAQFGRSPEWFYQEFDTQEKAASGLLPGIGGLQIGKIARLEGDPDGEFRVQVRFPLIDPESPGIWARLATLDAGDERGIVFRPEIDDEVIVGFINDDPRHPVILGQLHSSTKPAPIEPSDDNHEKGWVTRSKMRLHFDDEKKIITLETPVGKTVIMDEDAQNILLKDENGNMITIDGDGIRIESAKDILLKATGDVKVEGMNLQMKAQAEFKAEGTAGTELSSSAITTLKGSLIKIN